MPDPNEPQMPPEEIEKLRAAMTPPEEAPPEKSSPTPSESGSENPEPSSTPSDTPSPSTEKSDSTEPGNDSPSKPDATEEALPDDAPEALKTLEADALAKNNAAAVAVDEAEKAADAFEGAVDDHLVNEDEVGVIEKEFRETGEVPNGVRDVSVTCHKCGHRNPTSVTRKEFEAQLENKDVQPKFQTKCRFCNYVSTYVLTGNEAETVA